MKMFSYLLFILLFSQGCSSKSENLPILIGGQFSSCDYFTNSDGKKSNNLATPTGFSITPQKALEIVKNKTNFRCHNKMGAQVYADKNYYYFVRIGTGKYLDISKSLSNIRVVVSGKIGSYWYLTNGSI